MDTPWAANVRQSGQLRIVPEASLIGNWKTVFEQSLAEFNRLSKHHKLGVTLERFKDKDSAQAEVRLGTANGPIAFTYDGEDHSATLSGNGLHGLTTPIIRRTATDVIEKAFSFLPIEPKSNTPQGLRGAGINIMKVILVHEFIHACGLEKHSTDDVFEGVHTIDGDRIRVGAATMPPIFFSGATVQRIRDLWTT